MSNWSFSYNGKIYKEEMPFAVPMPPKHWKVENIIPNEEPVEPEVPEFLLGDFPTVTVEQQLDDIAVQVVETREDVEQPVPVMEEEVEVIVPKKRGRKKKKVVEEPENFLDKIKSWSVIDIVGWFEYIRGHWKNTEWGWSEKIIQSKSKKDKYFIEYNISTGQLPENDTIIDAMFENKPLWETTWYQTSRGGHYIFESNLMDEKK